MNRIDMTGAHSRYACISLVALIIAIAAQASAFHFAAPRRITSATGTTKLPMGLLDNLGSFLNKREGDFVKLESSVDTFGPGPVILLYGCPRGVTDDELKDMIEDGAPKASKSSSDGVICRRIDASDASLLNMSVGTALEKIAGGEVAATATPLDEESPQPPCPVIYFSGISNDEMMATYRIISSEMYEETGGAANAACAKAVPPAMEKPLRQVIEEITGDHLDAITPDEEFRDYGT